MSNKTYDILKKITLLILPAMTLFAALVDIWNIPYGSQVCATMAAVNVFAAAAISILSATYHKKAITTIDAAADDASTEGGDNAES